MTGAHVERATTGGAALAHPPTAEALAGHRRRAGRLALAGAVLAALGVTVGTIADASGVAWLSEGAVLFAGGGPVLALIGFAGLANAGRMRRVLHRAPWTVCRAETFPPGSGSAKVVLRDPVTSQLRTLLVLTTVQRMHLADAGPARELWWCRDERGRGVISRPGGTGLVWARPPHFGRSAKAEAKAVERGILALPHLPQPAAPRAYARRPAAEATSPAPAETAAPPVPRRRIRRWWPLVPLLLGLGSFFLGGMGYEASKEDPVVYPLVLSLRDDGSCTVRYKDPWDGTDRIAPFRCSADPGPDVQYREAGWVVSHGPWKGDLYDPSHAGTPAYAVYDALLVTGLVLLGVALAGGVAVGVRGLMLRHRRPPARAEFPVFPATPSPVVLAKPANGSGAVPGDFSYAAMAEAARRRAGPEQAGASPRAEADVRRMPWWRVRTLQEIAQLRQMITGAGITAAAAVAWWLWGSWLGWSVVASGACGALSTLVGAWQARHGVPAARAMARAACGPVPHPRRYILLYDPDDAPTLVLFSSGGGEDAMPEATLAVNVPAGSRRKPHSGVPAPVGAADLRARPDGRGPVDGATVVPWIGDRPLWPQHPLTLVDLDDPQHRAHLESLVHGVVVPATRAGEDDAARRTP